MRVGGLVRYSSKPRITINKFKFFVDYRTLYNACVHNPFPTPFSDEVLDNIAVMEHTLSNMASLVTTKSILSRRIRIK